MSHTFNAVRQIRNAVVHPSRFSIRMVAVILAALVGLAGNFMEASPQLKELDMSDVVEQIHATIERREAIKELEDNIQEFSLTSI